MSSDVLVGGDGGVSLPWASKRMAELVNYIRQYLRDVPELNRLIRGYESSDRLIAWALIETFDDYNSTPPFLDRIGPERFPDLTLIRLGAVSRILESVAILQLRNHLPFNDAGLSVSVADKGPILMQWAQLMDQKFRARMDRLKASLNIEMAMEGPGVVSEYYLVNNSYFGNAL